jgi:DNA-binding response OmpR family regulator
MTSSLRSRHELTRWPARGPARVLLVLQRPILIELIKLALNHGSYSTRAVASAAEVETAVAQWQPHLVVLDMDFDGPRIMTLLGTRPGGSGRLPVIGLTRRGDLKAKLAAFEAGADDILTAPFAPEELLARVSALVRRAYSDAVTFTPIITVGELEIDILKRTVRAGSSELQPALPSGGQRWQSGRPRGDPGHVVGHGLCGRKQHRGPPDPKSASAAG